MGGGGISFDQTFERVQNLAIPGVAVISVPIGRLISVEKIEIKKFLKWWLKVIDLKPCIKFSVNFFSSIVIEMKWESVAENERIKRTRWLQF